MTDNVIIINPAASRVILSAVTAQIADATTAIKGKIKLAGDLAGTADLPTVPGLTTKEPTITAGTVAQYWRGDKTFQTLDKTAVGLANVDNTSDANKPVSTATQTALDLKVPGGGAYLNPGFYITTSATRSTIQLGANSELTTPIWILNTGTIDRIAIEITAAGTAGTVIRLGIRSDNGTGKPDALMLDAGTVAGDAVALVEQSISQVISVPGLYHLTVTPQNTGATLPTLRVIFQILNPAGAISLAEIMGTSYAVGFRSGPITPGALPANYTFVGRSIAPALIALRAV